MKKSTFRGVLFTLYTMLIIGACSKSETTTPSTNPEPNQTLKMAPLTGIWKASGQDLPELERNSYASFELNVKADSSCVWTKTHKTTPSASLRMEGKMLFEATGVKDANGKLIDKIWFTFNKINGQDLSGGIHGIYQVDGNKLTLDWEFMQIDTKYPDPAKGFGSGAGGTKSISKYTKQ